MLENLRGEGRGPAYGISQLVENWNGYGEHSAFQRRQFRGGLPDFPTREPAYSMAAFVLVGRGEVLDGDYWVDAVRLDRRRVGEAGDAW